MLASNIQRDGYHMDLFTIFKREDNASLIKFDQNLAQLEWVNSDLIKFCKFHFHGSVVQNFKNWIALPSFRQAQQRGPHFLPYFLLPVMPFQNLPKTANYPKIKRVLPSFCLYQIQNTKREKERERERERERNGGKCARANSQTLLLPNSRLSFPPLTFLQKSSIIHCLKFKLQFLSQI